jgi:hypothetical protein
MPLSANTSLAMSTFFFEPLELHAFLEIKPFFVSHSKLYLLATANTRWTRVCCN